MRYASRIARMAGKGGQSCKSLLDMAVRMFSSEEKKFRQIWPVVEKIEGYLVSPQQERWLFRRACSLPDGSTIVEIGSFKGRSTCCLAYGCLGTNKHVYAVDTFTGNNTDFHHRDFCTEFQENIKLAGVSDYVTPMVGYSSEIAIKWNRPISLLFVDGSHEYEDVIADFEGFFPHVVSGGIVAVHDVVESWPGPLRAWHETIKHELRKIGYCSTLAYGKKL